MRAEGARAVTLWIAGITGYRGFDQAPDGSAADIAAVCRSRLEDAQAKDYPALRAAHIADHRRLFRRVSLKLSCAESWADAPDRMTAMAMRVCGAARPRSGGAVFPIRAVSVDCELASGVAAGEPARHLERAGAAAVEFQLDGEYQCANELLACGDLQSE